MASTLSTSEATKLAPARRGVKGGGKKRPGPYPYWFYVAPGPHLRSLLSRSHDRLVLLLLHPLGPVHVDLDRVGQLPDLLRGAGADHRPAQHADLRRDHLRAQGGPRHGAGPAADLEDHRAGLPALGHLLPRPGQRRRRRTHLHRVDEPRARADQPDAGRRRHRLADQPQPGHLLHRPGRRVEGRRTGHGHLHRRPGLDSHRVLRGRRGRRSRAAGTSSGTSSSPSPGRPRPR